MNLPKHFDEKTNEDEEESTFDNLVEQSLDVCNKVRRMGGKTMLQKKERV